MPKLCSVNQRNYSASLFLFVLIILTSPGVALAEKPDKSSAWNVSFGVGTFISPVYEGSSRYDARILPFFRISYQRFISFGPDGLKLKFKSGDRWKYGISLFPGDGRDEVVDTYLGEDVTRLNGLGDIDESVGITFYTSHTIHANTIKFQGTQFAGPDNDGSLATLKWSYSVIGNRGFRMKPFLSTTWVNSNYSNTFYGIDATQHTQSKFNRFQAESGLREISGGLELMTSLTRKWYSLITLSGKQLLGSAEKTPITQDNQTASAVILVGYRY